MLGSARSMTIAAIATSTMATTHAAPPPMATRRRSTHADGGSDARRERGAGSILMVAGSFTSATPIDAREDRLSVGTKLAQRALCPHHERRRQRDVIEAGRERLSFMDRPPQELR